MAAPTRPPSYPELLVGPCKVQTATDRFGSRAPAIVRRRDTAWALHLPNDIEDSDVIVPKMQRWGMNLTALSQRYNLYFAAYEHRIAVYRPRSVPRQSLPSMPDLVLIPDPTDAASWVQGHPSRDSPHQANHIIVGQLGYEEVLVAAYDDGDVVVYYTREIADQVARRADLSALSSVITASDTTPNPIFESNVGHSAWGLAVHARSRLIAVSCNRHDITIFALALDPSAAPQSRVAAASRPPVRNSSPAEALVRLRTRNWTIVVGLGSSANNLPSIAFLDDRRGFAEKISAIDINGLCWVADIYKTNTPVVALPCLRSSDDE